MRIGILTFHRAYNYGAFLQCFSLMRRLSRDFPEAQVEVIDFESQNMANYYKTDLLSLMFGHSNGKKKMTLKQRLRKSKGFLKKIKNDRTYVKKLKKRNESFEKALTQLPLSRDRIISDDREKIMEFINSQEYDLIVVGSDAIWNDAQTSKPNSYYLGQEINADYVSYAASSFGMDYTKKSDEELKTISAKVGLFKFIGTRDVATEEYVKLLGVDTSMQHTCDPSIILDLEQSEFSIERIKKELERNGIDFSKPIFGIMAGDWLGAIARKLIGEDAQLIALYEPNKYADFYLADISPFEWAKVFSLFTVTFTHFFHGTLFSLKNGTPTMSIEWENEYSAKFDTKILDVLKRLGLQDYRFTKNVAENDPESLKTHFDNVLKNLESEKKRISAALLKESKTYDAFAENIKLLLRR